jgi:predicted DNA-binding transcriptional regulator YafY
MIPLSKQAIAGATIMRQIITRALRQSDDLVLVFDYVDSKGVSTRRVVSPIRFLGNDRFLALCLSREEPRQFYLSRCENLQLDWAANFVMPVPMAAGVPALAG